MPMKSLIHEAPSARELKPMLVVTLLYNVYFVHISNHLALRNYLLLLHVYFNGYLTIFTEFRLHIKSIIIL